MVQWFHPNQGLEVSFIEIKNNVVGFVNYEMGLSESTKITILAVTLHTTKLTNIFVIEKLSY